MRTKCFMEIKRDVELKREVRTERTAMHTKDLSFVGTNKNVTN